MQLGSTDTNGVTATDVASSAGAVAAAGTDAVSVPAPGIMDGLKVWTQPSLIPGAFMNLPAMVTAAPMAAVGFLIPVAGVLFFVMQSGKKR